MTLKCLWDGGDRGTVEEGDPSLGHQMTVVTCVAVGEKEGPGRVPLINERRLFE